MNNILIISISIVTAYVIGSIPTAYLFGRAFKGIDIRKFGSGNVGATNVYRVIGKAPGFAVLFIDGLKGFLPALIFPLLIRNFDISVSIDSYKIIVGLSVIIGHVWTVFLNFKGGKGVAATAGVLLAILPKLFLIALVVWIISLVISRYVSVSSIIASISLPIAAFICEKPNEILSFTVFLCLASIYKHKSNIQRLLKGQEKRIF